MPVPGSAQPSQPGPHSDPKTDAARPTDRRIDKQHWTERHSLQHTTRHDGHSTRRQFDNDGLDRRYRFCRIERHGTTRHDSDPTPDATTCWRLLSLGTAGIGRRQAQPSQPASQHGHAALAAAATLARDAVELVGRGVGEYRVDRTRGQPDGFAAASTTDPTTYVCPPSPSGPEDKSNANPAP